MQNLRHIYLILMFSLVFFSLLSLTSTKIPGIGIKAVDLFSEIRKDKNTKEKKTSINKKSKLKSAPVLKHAEFFIANCSVSPSVYSFFNSLSLLKEKKKAKIRVAHFGDSAIESDLVTSELRKQYQLKYGGSGFGFIPMASIGPATRISSLHNFSKELKLLNIKEDNKDQTPVGLCGYSSLVPGGKVVGSELTTPKNCPNPGFTSLRFFYGPVSGKDEQIIINDSISILLSGTGTVNEINKTIKGTSVKLKTANKQNLIMYGYSTESDTGVVIDNYPFRGSSGTLFTNFSEYQLKAWDSLLQYDLIILQFGINAAGAKTTDYSWYKRKFTENLKYLRAHFPATPILIVGCGDRAIKKSGVYNTLSGIPYLIETQKEIAEENHCAFIDLFQLMGGDGTMVKWVKSNPALANKDYTHYTHKGAEKIGKILFDALESQYILYHNAQVSK